MFLRRAASTSRFGVVGSTATRGVFGVVMRRPVVVRVSLSWSSSDDAPLVWVVLRFLSPVGGKSSLSPRRWLVEFLLARSAGRRVWTGDAISAGGTRKVGCATWAGGALGAGGAPGAGCALWAGGAQRAACVGFVLWLCVGGALRAILACGADLPCQE